MARRSGPPVTEDDHFIVCPGCGVRFDMRNMDEALAHAGPTPHDGNADAWRASARHRELGGLARLLYGRRGEAVYVPSAEVRIGDGDWVPQPSLCYQNVEVWTRRCPEYRPIYGWVVFDNSFLPPGKQYFEFAGHAVVAAPDGRLLDITPNDAEFKYPFLRHEGDPEAFKALAARFSPLVTRHFLIDSALAFNEGE
jgi:hypothetical protein